MENVKDMKAVKSGKDAKNVKDMKSTKNRKGTKNWKKEEDTKYVKRMRNAETRKGAEKKSPESRFDGLLPEEILKELTPEVRRQYFLWDEIMKREIELYPQLILPVIQEIFHKKYPADRKIVLLSTEYTVSRIHEKGEKLLHAIRSDLLLEIGRDRYHFECQIEKDGTMVFRMLEYDVQMALTHGKMVKRGKGKKAEFSVVFPKSAVLYLGNEKSQPDEEACTIYFQDGTSHAYRVPVMKVQDYTLEMIAEKHLNLLIPFLLIRFRGQIKETIESRDKNILINKKRKILKRDLTDFLSECIMILQHEKEQGILTETAQKDIGEFLFKVCGYLLEEDTELYEEVSAEMEPAVKLSREIIQELQEGISALREDNDTLREDIGTLQEDNSTLQQKHETGLRNLVIRQKKEGRSIAETEDALIEIFLLTKEEAAEKAALYWPKE